MESKAERPDRKRSDDSGPKQGISRRGMLVGGAAVVGLGAAAILSENAHENEIAETLQERTTKITRKEPQMKFGDMELGKIYVDIDGKEQGFEVGRDDFKAYQEGDAIRVKFGIINKGTVNEQLKLQSIEKVGN